VLQRQGKLQDIFAAHPAVDARRCCDIPRGEESWASHLVSMPEGHRGVEVATMQKGEIPAARLRAPLHPTPQQACWRNLREGFVPRHSGAILRGSALATRLCMSHSASAGKMVSPLPRPLPPPLHPRALFSSPLLLPGMWKVVSKYSHVHILFSRPDPATRVRNFGWKESLCGYTLLLQMPCTSTVYKAYGGPKTTKCLRVKRNTALLLLRSFLYRSLRYR